MYKRQALYGEQGVNGVIVVTTKKGYNNKTTIEYDDTAVSYTHLDVYKRQSLYHQ